MACWFRLGAAGLARLCLATLALLVGGCQRPQEVTMPIASWPGYEYFQLAHARQLDRAEGLAINPLVYPDPQDIVRAYEQGRIRLAQLTTVEVVDICARLPSRCPVVVLILDESRGGDKLAVRRSIGSLEGLRGKRVGVTPTTLGPYVLSRALESRGMTLADVRIVPMPLADMGQRLASADIDGAAFFPPFSDQVLANGTAVEVFNSARIPGEIFDILVVDPEYYRSEGATVARLLRVWQQAHDLARQDPTAVDAMARRQGVSPEVFRESEKGLVDLPLRQQLPLLAAAGPLQRNLAAVLAVQTRLGLLRGKAVLPQVSDQALKQALE
ncbi:MAG: ABC transporter substrate-binding protein [Cyanobacteriota bacterium]